MKIRILICLADGYALFCLVDGMSGRCYLCIYFSFQMVPQLFVLSSNSILVLDQRTLVIKYRIPISEIEAMSLSPYSDRIVVFHLKKVRRFMLNGIKH